MKALLKTTWFQSILSMAIISLICFFLIGPKGIFYGPILMAFLFLQKLFTAIFTGRWI
ncbi:hypothetical protein V1291_005308 [Nitrobacteraceae bacterium AZCC 1564]